jgi:hypothetical protein
MNRLCLAAAGWLAVAILGYFPVPAAEESYEVGGPLAGVPLPLRSCRFGEPPGYPGCLPGKYEKDGLAPEWQLYDGAVEHWHTYMSKYLPVRSNFDRQSQRANWTAPTIPGSTGKVEPYAEPVYAVTRQSTGKFTGQFNPSLEVVRCGLGTTIFAGDLGPLDRGVYALRVIAAVEKSKLRGFRVPLFLKMTIDDGPGGALSTYRLRIGYCDEFYSVAEFYFHASGRRAFHAAIGVDRGSAVDLLVRNVSLDDCLVGSQWRPIKTRTTIHASKPPASSAARLDASKRRQRDALIWENFPPLNAQGGISKPGNDEHVFSTRVSRGVPGQTDKQIEASDGRWAAVPLAEAIRAGETVLLRQASKEVYTLADLAAHQCLPDPYPHKDDGAGLYFPDPQSPAKGLVWTPIADAVRTRIPEYGGGGFERASIDRYEKTGDLEAAHDAAIAIARFAYAFPTLDRANCLESLVCEHGFYGRDNRCRARETMSSYHPAYPAYVDPILFDYDRVFEYIRGSRELAESIGRFVPWVRTPEDVILLIDVYLVETTAKRILRWHFHTFPEAIAQVAAVLGDTRVTDPWMEWEFRRTFIYPFPLSGIQDHMVTGCERDGSQYRGSTFYSAGQGAMQMADALDRYVRSGGNPRYNLANPELFSKPVAHAYFQFKNIVAGYDFLRIGDVTGPDKNPGSVLRKLEWAHTGWQWTKDPRFAFVIKHYLSRANETDAEWSAIETAAAQQRRAPWLDLRSRVMPMWATILEAGLEYDDHRFRRAAYVRTGFGKGHGHADALDLQIVAHGLPATIDGGQRGGYSIPDEPSAGVHNLVLVDDAGVGGYSWATTLSDAEGARYAAVQLWPRENVPLFRRQFALIDASAGHGAKPVSIAQQLKPEGLPKDVVLPDCYVFDVFRVSGGKSHTYAFHGTVDDEFQWNAQGEAPPAAEDADAALLRTFQRPEMKRVGTAPATFEATWRLAREYRGRPGTHKSPLVGPWGTEKSWLGKDYDPDAPARYTRLHLLDVNGAKTMRGQVFYQDNYHYTCSYVRRKVDQPTKSDQPLESAFAAIIEPYLGEPILTSVRRLDVAGNESDAQRAVAVQVTTAAGHTDVCFADGRPEKLRRIAAAKLAIAGEFGFYSADKDGLRQATLTGGTMLESPTVRISLARAERRAKIVAVDYPRRTFRIDQPWPACASGIFEVVSPGYRTAYQALAVRTEGQGAAITHENGADVFLARVTAVDVEHQTVETSLTHIFAKRGITQNLAASNEEGTKFWRATYLDGKYHLAGEPITAETFARSGGLRLWEYGVGDEVRQSLHANLRRVRGGVYELTANAGVTVGLPGKQIKLAHNGPSTVATATAGGFTQITIPEAEVSADRAILLEVEAQ